MLPDLLPERVRSEATLSLSVALLSAGILTAWVLPYRPLGINLVLVAIASWTAVGIAQPVALRLWPMTMAATSILLAATAAYTDSLWAVALCILGAPWFAALAVSTSEDWNGIARAIASPVLRLIHIPFFVTAPIRQRLSETQAGFVMPALRGLGLAATLLFVFAVLFATADRAFAYYVSELTPELDLSRLPLRILVFGVIAFGTGAVAICGTRYMGPFDAEGEWPKFSLGPGEWLSALLALNLLFAAFVVVQITVLFGGSRHVLETAGLTYSEYARSGFFQLLVAAALTLGVVGAAARWAKVSNTRDGWTLQLLLGGLCLFTLVILLSALRRLGLYEAAYGFTRDRFLAHAILLWMGAVFVALLIAGSTGLARFLPRTLVILTGISLIVFGFSRPDAFISGHNVDRFLSAGNVDLDYLATLSADAVPEFTRLPEDMERCILSQFDASSDSALSYNAARSHARSLLGGRTDLTAGQDCFDQFRQQRRSFGDGGY